MLPPTPSTDSTTVAAHTAPTASAALSPSAASVLGTRATRERASTISPAKVRGTKSRYPASAGDGTGIWLRSESSVDQYRSPQPHATMPAATSSQAARSRPPMVRPRQAHSSPAESMTPSLAYLPRTEPLSGCDGIQHWMA